MSDSAWRRPASSIVAAVQKECYVSWIHPHDRALYPLGRGPAHLAAQPQLELLSEQRTGPRFSDPPDSDDYEPDLNRTLKRSSHGTHNPRSFPHRIRPESSLWAFNPPLGHRPPRADRRHPYSDE